MTKASALAAQAFCKAFNLSFPDTARLEGILGFDNFSSRELQRLAFYGDAQLRYWVCRQYLPSITYYQVHRLVSNRFLASVVTQTLASYLSPQIQEEIRLNRIAYDALGTLYEALLALIDTELGWNSVSEFLDRTFAVYYTQICVIVDADHRHLLNSQLTKLGCMGAFSIVPGTCQQKTFPTLQWYVLQDQSGKRLFATQAISYDEAVLRFMLKCQNILDADRAGTTDFQGA